MSPRAIGAIVLTAVLAIIGTYMFVGGSHVSAAPLGPTDLVDRQTYQVHDTFVCDADPTMQVREWHFDGTSRLLRAQSTVDWYVDLDGRKVIRVFYRPAMFAKDGKKYMMIARTTEADRAREGFDANGSDRRWADVVYHNIRLERQGVVGPCGPAR